MADKYAAHGWKPETLTVIIPSVGPNTMHSYKSLVSLGLKRHAAIKLLREMATAVCKKNEPLRRTLRHKSDPATQTVTRDEPVGIAPTPPPENVDPPTGRELDPAEYDLPVSELAKALTGLTIHPRDPDPGQLRGVAE